MEACLSKSCSHAVVARSLANIHKKTDTSIEISVFYILIDSIKMLSF